jgi:transglutaminase-like putative cysteine protease
MLIQIGFDIELGVTAPTALIYMLQVHPSRAADIADGEHITISPPLHTDHYRDAFDNHCARVRVPAGVSSVRLRNEAVVFDSGWADPVDLGAVEHMPADLPVETLPFLLPSRYCEVDSELRDVAWSLFGTLPAGWPLVQSVCNFVFQHIRFDYMQARANRTALEVYRERTGVCRDFMHLAITFCRSLNVPARYCTGYLGDIGVPPQPCPMDFSAWFEVYLGGRWCAFDARNNTPRIGRILMARGRDAADVALTTTFGVNILRTFQVWTDEVAADALAGQANALV